MDLILLHFCVEYKSLANLDLNPQLKPEQIEMKISTSIFVLLTVVSVCSGMGFTALDIDNHPCKPENLKVCITISYCTHSVSVRAKKLSELLV